MQLDKQMVVSHQSKVKPNQLVETVALFNEDGSPYIVKKVVHFSAQDILGLTPPAPEATSITPLTLLLPTDDDKYYVIDSLIVEWILRSDLIDRPALIGFYADESQFLSITEGELETHPAFLGNPSNPIILKKETGHYIIPVSNPDISVIDGMSVNLGAEAHVVIGKGIILFAITPFKPPGAILTSEIHSAGTGFEVGDTVSLGFPSDIEARVDSVDESGAIVSYTLTNPSTTSGTAIHYVQSATSGSGTGFEIICLTNDGVLDAELYVDVVAHVVKING